MWLGAGLLNCWLTNALWEQTCYIQSRVETGRWIGLEREDRICGRCGLREVENVEHFVLRCDGLVREREVLMKRMAEVTTGFEERCDEEKATLVLSEGCRDLKAG